MSHFEAITLPADMARALVSRAERPSPFDFLVDGAVVLSFLPPLEATMPLTVSQQIDALVLAAKAKHQDLGLSFGYVGNLDRHGRDDRTFKVFTNRVTDMGHSVSFGYHGIDSLPALLVSVQSPAFDAFLARASECRRPAY